MTREQTESIEQVDRELAKLTDGQLQLWQAHAPAPAEFREWGALTPEQRRGWRAGEVLSRRARAVRIESARQAERSANATEDAAAARALREQIRNELLATVAGRALSPAALEALVDQAVLERMQAERAGLRNVMRQLHQGKL